MEKLEALYSSLATKWIGTQSIEGSNRNRKDLGSMLVFAHSARE